MKKNQNGFGIAVLLIFLIIIAVVAAGWYSLKSRDSVKDDEAGNSSEITKKYINQGPGMDPTLSDGQELYGVVKPAHEVKRGDIIVFEPSSATIDRMVKRVIGLPGDTVTIENGIISVSTSDGSTYNPSLTAASTHPKIIKAVEADSFFVVGDNLSNSLDSRTEAFGLVPFSNLLSVIVL